MSFECASQVADDCVGSDLFDPPFRDEDGAAICTACASELGLFDRLKRRERTTNTPDSE